MNVYHFLRPSGAEYFLFYFVSSRKLVCALSSATTVCTRIILPTEDSIQFLLVWSGTNTNPTHDIQHDSHTNTLTAHTRRRWEQIITVEIVVTRQSYTFIQHVMVWCGVSVTRCRLEENGRKEKQQRSWWYCVFHSFYVQKLKCIRMSCWMNEIEYTPSAWRWQCIAIILALACDTIKQKWYQSIAIRGSEEH